MAKTTLDVAIRVKGKNELETLIKRMDVLEKEVGQLNGKLPKATNNVRKFGGASKQASDGVRSLTRNMARLAAGAGLGLFAKSAFDAAANVENLQARTKILTTEFTQLAGIEQVAAASADRLKLSNSQVLASYIDLGNRLGEQGTSLNDIQQVYEGLNTVLVKNKSSTAEAASATLQLNQALGAGRLAGEEFRAVNEATPQVISEIAKVLGVARGEVKGLAADGLVSSQVVIQALTNINKKGAAQLEEGFTGAFKAQREFNKALIEFKEVVGSELLPVITPFITGITELLKGFGQLDPFVQKAIIGFTAFSVGALILAPAIVAVGKAMFGLAGFIGALKLGAAAAGVGKLSLAFVGLKVALLALPWVAVAAGVAALTYGVIKYNQKQAETKALINGTEFEMSKYETAIKQTNDKLAEAKSKLDKMKESGTGNARAINAQTKRVQELKKQLEGIKGTYTARVKVLIDIENNSKDILGTDYRADGPGGRLVPINPGETVSQKIEREEREKAEKLAADKHSGGGGGSSSAPRESQLPQLNQELAATQKLLDVNRQLLDAQLAEDTALVQQLEATRILTEYENQLAEIALEKIPANEKAVKGQIALTKAMGQQAELANTIKTGEKERLTELDQLLTGFDREIALSQVKGDYAKQLKQIEFDILDLREQGLLKTPEEIAAYRERATAAAGFKKQLSGSKQMLSDAYDIVSGELTSSIEGLIDGTKEWGDVLSDIAGQLGKMFLNAGFNALGGQIGIPGMGGKAAGGGVNQNTPYLVGENGPEMFVPQASGRVVNNTDSKMAMERYSYQDNGPAKPSKPINVQYNVTEINGMRFVTEDQLQRSSAAAAKEGAKSGESRVMSSLRNSRSRRKSLGF